MEQLFSLFLADAALISSRLDFVGRSLAGEYIRPKKEHKLPDVLSLEEVKNILSQVQHKAILYLTYSSGLRVGEVVRLRPSDIDAARHIVKVRQGKGRKDRFTILSETAFKLVEQYLEAYKPQKWLFPGQSEGSHLSDRSVQKVFETNFTSVNCDSTS